MSELAERLEAWATSNEEHLERLRLLQPMFDKFDAISDDLRGELTEVELMMRASREKEMVAALARRVSRIKDLREAAAIIRAAATLILHTGASDG